MAKRKELKAESLEEEVKELKKSIRGMFEVFLPPKEIREEILKDIYNIELSFLRIFKTLLDYEIEVLEKKTEGKGKKKKAQRIEVE